MTRRGKLNAGLLVITAVTFLILGAAVAVGVLVILTMTGGRP